MRSEKRTDLEISNGVRDLSPQFAFVEVNLCHFERKLVLENPGDLCSAA